MGITLPDGKATYSFQDPQQYAFHLRLTPEAKQALLRAQQSGQASSLRLTETGSDNALIVGGQTFGFHPPNSQQHLDLFSKSEVGCVQVGHIHQKAVVKRSTLQGAHQQTQTQAAHQRVSQQNGQKVPAGPAQHGHAQAPNGQPVRKQQHAGSSSQPTQQPPAQQRPPTAPSQGAKGSHAAAASRQSVGNRQLPAPRQTQVKPPPPTFNSQPPSAQPTSHQHGQTSQPAHPEHQAPPGTSNQSAQTAVAPKPHGKGGKGQPSGASTIPHQPPEVLEQVCAAARKGQKEAMLVALLQCRPPKNAVLEALFKDVEKKVPGFKRLQGDSYKRACSKYAQMKSGAKWELKDNFHQEALNIVAGKPPVANPPAEPSVAQPSSGIANRDSADLQAAAQRRPPSEPQARNGGAQLEPQPGADQVKKKKGRLTKAADMGGNVQPMQVQEPSGTGLKRKMQTAGLTDSDSGEEGAIPSQPHKFQKGPSGSGYPTQNGCHPSTTAAATAAQLNGLSGHHRDQQCQDGRDAVKGHQASDAAGGSPQAGSIGAEGRSPSQQPLLSSGHDGQAAAAAPAQGSRRLKVTLRRPLAEGYDESWFAEHVDRQPSLKGALSSIDQWEDYLLEYNSKHAVYFRLHQEMQDTKIKVEGLRQAARQASSDSERLNYQQQFDTLWKKRQPRVEKWDKAFNVLDKELVALHHHLQAFHDKHAAGT